MNYPKHLARADRWTVTFGPCGEWEVQWTCTGDCTFKSEHHMVRFLMKRPGELIGDTISFMMGLALKVTNV